MEYEDYRLDLWIDMPKDIISDEYYTRNRELMDRITYDMYRLHSNLGSFPPKIARAVMGSVFGSIKDIGLR